MASEKEIITWIARDKMQNSIKEYTNKLLAQTTLGVKDKLKLLALNQHDRLNIIKRIQHHTLEHLFKNKPDTFHTKSYHYDWWAFPMHVPVEWHWEERNYHASIDRDEAFLLLKDPEFTNNYLTCINLYLNALQNHGWNDYPVRYARMLHSLSLFLNTAYEMEHTESMYLELRQTGQRTVEYATSINLTKTYPDYTLLLNGFNNVKAELKKFVDTTPGFGV